MEGGDVLLLWASTNRSVLLEASICVAAPGLPDALLVVLPTPSGGLEFERFHRYVRRHTDGYFVECVFAEWNPAQRRAVVEALFQAADWTPPIETALLSHPLIPPNGAMECWWWQTCHPSVFRQLLLVAFGISVATQQTLDWSVLHPDGFAEWSKELMTLPSKSHSAA